jgi:hypothetical protein
MAKTLSQRNQERHPILRFMTKGFLMVIFCYDRHNVTQERPSTMTQTNPKQSVVVAPSILSADFSRLGEEIQALIKRVPIGFMSMLWMAGSCRTSPLAP